MKKAIGDAKNILKGVSTLDIMNANLRMILLLLMMTAVLSGAIYGRLGHSILDLVDPSFNPQVSTSSFTNKSVFAVAALPNGKILVSGQFNSYNRQPVGGLVRLNADGSLDTTFNNNLIAFLANSVRSNLMVQTDGKIIISGIGGNLTLNNQTASSKAVFRLNSDGSLDSSFNYNVSGSITGTALDTSGRMLIVGSFQIIENGVSVTRSIVRLNADGSLDSSFRFLGSAFSITIATQNNKVIVGMSSGQVQIIRLNEDGTSDTSFTQKNLNLFVNKIIVQPDNKILILDVLHLQRLQENGSDDSSFQPTTFSTSTKTIGLANDGKIVSVIASSTGVQFLRFLPNGLNDASFNQYVHQSYFSMALQSDGGVIIGDFFNGGTSGTTIPNEFVRLFPNGTLDTSFNSSGIGFQTAVPGGIRAIGLQANEKVLIGGKFDEVNGVARFKIARLNNDATLDNSFQVNTSGTGNYFSQITEIYNIRAQNDGKLIITGRFTYLLNGVAKSNLVRLNSDGSIDSTFNLSVPIPEYFGCCGFGTNRFVPFSDGKILVGTSRISQDGRAIPIKLTAAGLGDSSFNPTIYNTNTTVAIFDVALQPDEKILIAGLHFAGSIIKSFVARLNANGSIDPTFQVAEEIDKQISSLALLPSGKILIVKGNTAVVQQSNVLRLNADGSVDNSFNAGTGADGNINAVLLLPNGKIFVGGKFTSFNGQLRQNLVQLNADGSLVPITYNLNDEVLSLAVDGDGRVLVGGVFTIISAGGGSANRSYIARLIDSVQTNGQTRFDFDGDGRADLGVFEAANGTWSIFNSQTNQSISTRFGLSNDKTAAADFDGDGKTDIAVYRPTEGIWYLMRSRDGFAAIRWGAAEDKPIAGDFDGDGKADFAVWRPSSGVWYVLQSSNGQSSAVKFGLTGDIPLSQADFDGDGKTDIAVWRPSDGNFYWLASGSANQFRVIHFGQSGDIPAVADYNGDGKTDLVVYRPTEGNWYQYLTAPNGQYVFAVTRFGINGDEPVAADYDGDGKTDIAVRRGNAWHILNSTQGYTVQAFGNANAQAVAAFPAQ